VNLLKKIKTKIRRVFIKIIFGNNLDKLVEKINKNSSDIKFLSSMSSEQTKLLASLAIVQNDIAMSIDKDKSKESSEDYITLKIPLNSDEFTN
jgi:hypothetical protein